MNLDDKRVETSRPAASHTPDSRDVDGCGGGAEGRNRVFQAEGKRVRSWMRGHAPHIHLTAQIGRREQSSDASDPPRQVKVWTQMQIPPFLTVFLTHLESVSQPECACGFKTSADIKSGGR